MANFATVENNDITGKYDLLPKSWKHVSGFDLLKDDETVLNNFGWYTIQKVEVTYNPETQYISDYSYDFTGNKVYETPVLADHVIPVVDPIIPETEEELFQNALSALRIERDILISKCDWTQLIDVQQLHDDDWKTSWATYRQSLRDLPNRCISGELNIYELIWPTEPN
jgi:hypothetical protein